MPYQNPFRAIGGLTVAGGANTGVMGAMQHPDQFAHAEWLARHEARMRPNNPVRNPFATNGGFQSREEGGGFDGTQIRGYSGGGIPTNLFSQLTGRGPTAYDVEQANGGGLVPAHNQMGTIPMNAGLSPWQMLQQAAGAPMTTAMPSPVAHRIPITADNADNIPPNAMMAADGGNIPAGQPVVVGERGPELMVPSQNSTVVPNEYLPTHMLMKGDILGYLRHYLHS